MDLANEDFINNLGPPGKRGKMESGRQTDILSLYADQIKYREEDLSFPIQTLAKDQENTG